jgi:hypothetical protein
LPDIEQRLQEGVELLALAPFPSSEVQNPAQGLPASAWEDRTVRPFVPWSYRACLIGEPPLALDFLPAEAQDLLRRSPSMDTAAGCSEVTLEDARVLIEILSDAGFEPTEEDAGPGGLRCSQPERRRGPGIRFYVPLPGGYPGW